MNGSFGLPDDSPAPKGAAPNVQYAVCRCPAARGSKYTLLALSLSPKTAERIATFLEDTKEPDSPHGFRVFPLKEVYRRLDRRSHGEKPRNKRFRCRPMGRLKSSFEKE